MIMYLNYIAVNNYVGHLLGYAKLQFLTKKVMWTGFIYKDFFQNMLVLIT